MPFCPKIPSFFHQTSNSHHKQLFIILINGIAIILIWFPQKIPSLFSIKHQSFIIVLKVHSYSFFVFIPFVIYHNKFVCSFYIDWDVIWVFSNASIPFILFSCRYIPSNSNVMPSKIFIFIMRKRPIFSPRIISFTDFFPFLPVKNPFLGLGNVASYLERDDDMLVYDTSLITNNRSRILPPSNDNEYSENNKSVVSLVHVN